MKSKVGYTLVLLLTTLLITGCSYKKEVKDPSSNYNIDGYTHTTCKRDAVIEDNYSTSININFDLYSDQEGYLKILKSKEEIISSNQDLLNEYEQAYRKIYKAYDEVKYYDNKVERNDNRLTSTTTINYGLVDMDKIMEIEGTEDNVEVHDGKIKVSDWKKFAKKYGTVCK